LALRGRFAQRALRQSSEAQAAGTALIARLWHYAATAHKAPGSKASLPMSREFIPEDRAKQQTHYTTCYMCACRCGVKVTVDNGHVRFIEGNRSHPVNHGVICAKGSAGIMKQYSPAKLSKPLRRRSGSERGAGDFVEIEWDEALDLLTARLAKIRATNPTQLAFFTGRDQ